MATYNADTYTRIGYNSIPDNGRIGYGSFDVVLDLDELLAQQGKTALVANDVVNLCRLPINSAVQRVVTTIARPLVAETTSGAFAAGVTLKSVTLTPKLNTTDAGAVTLTVASGHNAKGYANWGGGGKDLKSTSVNDNTLSVTIGAITDSGNATTNQIIGGKLIFSVLALGVLDPVEVSHLNPDEANATTGGV